MATFHDIIGQEQIKEHLQSAISAKKIAHAYISNGEKSSGKEFIARVFAMTLQCEKGGTEPCQECHSCKQALSDNQMCIRDSCWIPKDRRFVCVILRAVR